MPAMDDERLPSRLRYQVETYNIGDENEEALFSVRRNGIAFYLRLSASQFINSPATLEKYLSYLEILRSGEEVIGDVFDTDVYDWVTQPFERYFAELAPNPSRSADTKVTLQESLYPKFFVFELDVVDEELQPRRVEMEERPLHPTFAWIEDEELDDLEEWTAIHGPESVTLSFENPEDALFKRPCKVLIDDGQTACFFKPCHGAVTTTTELRAYKKIAMAGLDPELHICRLHGVVMDHRDYILGLLLTYIGHSGRMLYSNVDPDYPPAATRARWVKQLDTALAELHKAGVVWGDVKADNVMLDQDDNPWIIDFGGGYTQGWVEKEVAGTVEGDLAGMAKLREFIFQTEEQDRWWTR